MASAKGAVAALASTLLLAAGLGTTAAVTPACAGNDCQADTQTQATCDGELVSGDPDVWESGPVTGTYLDFHGERTWTFDPTGWMGDREPYEFDAYLSLDPNPTSDGGGGFAQPAGNLAEITPVKVKNGWQVQVLNDTCAQYYLRLVLTYPPKTGAAGEQATCVAGDAGDD